MASLKLKLNQSRALKDGNYPVVFQLIHQKRKKLIYTKYRMIETEFIPISQNVITGIDTVCEVSRALRKVYKKLEAQIRRLESRGCEYSVDDIAKIVLSRANRKFILLSYIDAQIEWKRSKKKNGIAAAYSSTRSSLARYIGRKEINLSQVNSSFVNRYKDYLYESGVAENTIVYYIRNFRALYNLAIKDGFVPSYDYPFRKVSTRPCKTVKRALDRERMLKLSCLSLKPGSEMKRSLDLFLFGFYAQGMAFVDIVYLKWKNVSGNLIVYRRHKSKQLIQIDITPQIWSLINEHGANAHNADEYVFPIIKAGINEYIQYRSALGRINRHLKKISAKLNIHPPLTTYTARHTWATLAREYGAPVSAISEGLGHTKEEMTLVYLKELDLTHLYRINKKVNNLL